MRVRLILGQLRAGRPLSRDDLRWFALGLADGTVSDAQAGAFAMAVCKSGLSADETTALTEAMRDSGTVLQWRLRDGPVLDKHSTGGLGDATSLVVAPILAALDCYAPFLSGRGLGHTGGTLDKLESIPGVATEVDNATLRRIVAEVGCAIVGATDHIAPADRRLYALRDETATVDSRALIVASILSKKLAGGAAALMLDVKGGSGAFMKTREEAEALARTLVDTANAAGCPTRALITDMNQPLAPSVGNAVEIREVMDVLRNPRPESRLCRLSLALAGELVALAGRFGTAEDGGRAALDALQTGAAAERFSAMVHALGGPAGFTDDPDKHLGIGPVERVVPAPEDGVVCAIDGVALGQSVQHLGGGRGVATDTLNPAVGLSRVINLGVGVAKGDPLAMIHAADTASAERAVPMVTAAIQIGQRASVPPLIHGRIA